MIYSDWWNLCRRWQEIIHETGIDKLSLFIINKPLKKGSADALCHASMHLPFDDDRINHLAAVMHRRIFYERYHASFWIDFDDGSMNAAGKTGMRWAVKFACF